MGKKDAQATLVGEAESDSPIDPQASGPQTQTICSTRLVLSFSRRGKRTQRIITERVFFSSILAEVLLIYRMMADGSLNERACMRLINVIILFQCIAANRETQQKLMNSCLVNFLVPLVLFVSQLEVCDNVRAVASSVFGILCQARECRAVQWAIENEVVEVCLISMDTRNEPTRVIDLHIVESVLRVDFEISYIFSSAADHLLNKLMRTLDNLVNQIAIVHDFSPRILFHTIRCYTLLCHVERGHNLVKQSLPESFINGTFHECLKDFLVIYRLLSQLLLIAGLNAS